MFDLVFLPLSKAIFCALPEVQLTVKQVAVWRNNYFLASNCADSLINFVQSDADNLEHEIPILVIFFISEEVTSATNIVHRFLLFHFLWTDKLWEHCETW